MPLSKRTKIVCTIGPASKTPAKLRRMIKAGMNVARLNLSHGTQADHKQIIKNVRIVSKDVSEPVAIIGDLQGPKIRVGDLPDRGIKLVKGKIVEVPVTYKNLYRDVKTGHRILLDDGLLEGEIVNGGPGFLRFKVVVGGDLSSHKGMNFPQSSLKVSAITDKDRRDAEFCVRQGLQWVALSFVTDPKDVRRMKRILKAAAKAGQALPKIIAKIEKHEAVDRFDEILAEVDAVMVARGDLGIEIAAERVPLLQKEFIDKCRAVAKPVIVATQMLDSMIRNPRPTRAEVSDVANAVIDHADALMLSGETATGKYPVQAVETMTRVVRETEASHFDDVTIAESAQLAKLVKDAVGGAASLLAQTSGAKLILVATRSGDAARMVSRFRPELPIIAAVPTEFVSRQLNVSWAVSSIVVTGAKKTEDLIRRSVQKLKRSKLARSGDKIIILAGHPTSNSVNFVEVMEI